MPWPDGVWMWVTQGDSKFDLVPLLFESQHQAQHYATTVWGGAARVELYREIDDA